MAGSSHIHQHAALCAGRVCAFVGSQTVGATIEPHERIDAEAYDLEAQEPIPDR